MGSNNPIIQTIYYLTGMSPMVVFILQWKIPFLLVLFTAGKHPPDRLVILRHMLARAWRLQGPGAWRTPKLAIAGRDLEAGEGRDQRVAGGAVHSACRHMQISWKASWIFVARACRVATHTHALQPGGDAIFELSWYWHYWIILDLCT